MHGTLDTEYFKTLNGNLMDMNTITTISPSATVTGVTNTRETTFDVRPPVEAMIDRYQLNEFVVQHRVQEQELLKLKETNVDYAEIIKENLAKSCSKDLMKKMTFTKKTDIDSDTHSFRGRVWVFTKEELTQMITEIRNGI